ncbi:MAG: MFS transporter [Thermoplasmata archaeon]|nr:MFS transporter [Thermoplasmata archaeon]
MEDPTSPASEGHRSSALGNRDFQFLWVAGLVSNAGDFVLAIGLPFFVFELTGSTLDTGLTLAAFLGPQIALSSFAGVFVDRWDRRWTMIVMDLLLAAGLLPLLFVQTTSALWIVYGVAVLESCLSQFFNPAEGALLPALVGEEHLVEANALNSSGLQASRLVGSASGGLVVGFWGLMGVSLVDSASFLASALLLTLIAARPTVLADAGKGVVRGIVRSLRKVGAEWRDGLRISLETLRGRVVLVFTAITSFGEGVFGALVVPFIVAVLHGNGPDYGWFSAIQAVGGIVGGLLVARYGGKWAPTTVLPITAVVFGVIDIAIFTYPLVLAGIGLAFVLVGIVGLPGAALISVFSSLRQTAVPDSHRGRFLGAAAMTGSSTALGGIILASVLSGSVGVIPVLEIQGIGYVLAGVVAWRLLRVPTPTRVRGPELLRVPPE